jgi:hypothetical protein
MSNIFKQNINLKNVNIVHIDEKINTKHYPTSAREWDNSIYAFNKNTLSLIPQTTISSLKLIKNYFNLYNDKLERKIRENRFLVRLRKLSSNKIYISNGEFKHTNNNVYITLYLFNRQKQNYLLNIEKRYINKFKYNINKINKIIKLIKGKTLISINKLNSEKLLLMKVLKTYNEKDTNYKNISDYIISFYGKLINKTIKSISLYLYYKQLLFINESKLNYIYLQYLKKYLEKLYGKNVIFNLVNLRQFFLNSDILSDSITLKIRTNRRKLLKYLKTIKNKVKLHKKKYLYELDLTNWNKYSNNNRLESMVLKDLKYKKVTGFRLEAKGRLTRRYTASRSAYKLIYKGNLTNIDSSYNSLSSVILRGNIGSNIQYTKLKGKTRIGSFGIKGWVSGN